MRLVHFLTIATLTTSLAMIPAASADDFIGYACAGSDLAGPDACWHATVVDGNGAICTGALIDGAHVAVVCHGDAGCQTYIDVVGVYKDCVFLY